MRIWIFIKRAIKDVTYKLKTSALGGVRNPFTNHKPVLTKTFQRVDCKLVHAQKIAGNAWKKASRQTLKKIDLYNI